MAASGKGEREGEKREGIENCLCVRACEAPKIIENI